MWITAKVIPSGINNYFYTSALLLALLFIFISFITFKMKPEFGYLLPLAPAAVACLYINWDLWAIATMMLAIYWFDRKAEVASAVALGIAISTKFLPVFLLIPIAIIFFRQEKISKFLKYAVIAVATFALINLPVALTTPEGWWRFYDLNLNRGSDWGSLWYALSLLGVPLNQLNLFSLLTFLILLAAFALYFFELKFSPTLAEISFIVMAASTAVNKVYSPQYVLWLAPLAIMVLQKNRSLFTAFWIWQGGEILYHVAIWQHLASYSGAKFGLSDGGYAVATLLRIATTAFFIAQIVRFQLRAGAKHAGKPQSRLLDFLFDAGKSYP
jgi:uncharacterized membrane protein